MINKQKSTYAALAATILIALTFSATRANAISRSVHAHQWFMNASCESVTVEFTGPYVKLPEPSKREGVIYQKIQDGVRAKIAPWQTFSVDAPDKVHGGHSRHYLFRVLDQQGNTVGSFTWKFKVNLKGVSQCHEDEGSFHGSSTRLYRDYARGEAISIQEWKKTTGGYFQAIDGLLSLDFGKYFKNIGGFFKSVFNGIFHGGFIKSKPGTGHAVCILTADPSEIRELSRSEKAELIGKYAPLIWLANDEKYLPSSVEFAFPHLQRYQEPNDNGRYWVRTKKALSKPSAVLPFFHGQGVSAPVYAFWVKKDQGYVDVAYFRYYPYNRGKELAHTIWGNHVGDWEHCTIRFAYSCQNENYRPIQVYGAFHSSGEALPWDEVAKAGTHPIVYSAWGSHATYFVPGDHTYSQTPVGALVDQCSKGLAWQSWMNLKMFDIDNHVGINVPKWPNWLNKNFSAPGSNPSRPDSGAIYRWGNHESGAKVPTQDVHQLEHGPTGPISKSGVWDRAKFE